MVSLSAVCVYYLLYCLHSLITERAQPRSHSAPHTKGNVRSSAVKMKRNIPRRPTTAAHVHKEIASLRKSASSGVSDAEERPGASVHPSIVPVTRPALCEHVQTQMSLLNGPSTRMNCNGIRATSAQPALEHGPEGATFFNCRLPTSTPTLSPQHSSHPGHFGHEGYNQVLPQGGAAHFPSGFITTALSAPTVMSYAPAPGQHDSAVPSYQPTCEANTVLQLGNNGQQTRESDLLQCIAAHLAQLQRCETQNQKPGSPAETVCERDEPRRGEIDQASSEEDEDFNQLDMAPVRDIGCQTSFDKNSLKPKKSSPEKAERKIKTVKYLLGEIKALVADQVDDGEALRLVTELEHIVCLLPAVVGSTNVHAEIALALQPLRSENAQLRR
ncbi:hypothetical protein FKM82_025768 [Ascaphus truei]